MSNDKTIPECAIETHLLHGAVQDGLGLHISRNYSTIARLEEYLRKRPYKYGEADAGGRTHELTVDDSTVAGARACWLARKFGHDVTFFINPWQIIVQAPYWWSIVDHALDRLSGSVKVSGSEFNANTFRGRIKLRNAIKASLRLLPGAAAVEEATRLVASMGVDQVDLPDDFLPPSVQTVEALASAGVKIGNHGWDHRDIGTMSEIELIDDCERTAKWIQEAIGVRSEEYAVPYGYPVPAALFARNVAKRVALVATDDGSIATSMDLVFRQDINGLVSGHISENAP